MIKCVKCNKNSSVLTLYYVNKSYCANCFSELFENRVRKTIRKNSFIERDDKKIAVALSGGLKSSVLLKILNDSKKRAPQSELVAITIRSDDKQIVFTRKECDELKVKLHVISPLRRNKGSVNEELLCAKKKLKIDKIALGNSLDDFVSIGFRRFLNGGDVEIMKTDGLIYPLRDCPLDEIRAYAKNTNIKFLEKKKDGEESEIEKLIEKLENKHPGTKFQILSSIDEMGKILKG